MEVGISQSDNQIINTWWGPGIPAFWQSFTEEVLHELRLVLPNYLAALGGQQDGSALLRLPEERILALIPAEVEILISGERWGIWETWKQAPKVWDSTAMIFYDFYDLSLINFQETLSTIHEPLCQWRSSFLLVSKWCEMRWHRLARMLAVLQSEGNETRLKGVLVVCKERDL